MVYISLDSVSSQCRYYIVALIDVFGLLLWGMLMFGKDVWFIIKLIYIIIKALLAMDPDNGNDLPNPKDIGPS